MKTLERYNLKSNFYILNDAPARLMNLFQDSHALFRMRVQKLGNVSNITNDEESEALRIMLEVLIKTKKQLLS